MTNWEIEVRSAVPLLAHYRQRGSFEDRLGEFNHAIDSHLSSQSFAENETTLLLGMVAYNLGSVLRNEFEDAHGSGLDLSHFQAYVLKAGARVVKHARRLFVRVAQSVRASGNNSPTASINGNCPSDSK